MKSFLIATTLLATVATSASAMTVRAPTLLPSVETVVAQLVPGADVENLKPSQVAALNGIFVNSNDLRNDIDRRSFINTVLGWN
jgi:hypothetical protein